MSPSSCTPVLQVTVAQQFSSEVDPQNNWYFTWKRRQAAKNRGEFISIRELSRDPNGYDVLITNLKHETLEATIAGELGILYLSIATNAWAGKVIRVANGYIYRLKEI